MILCKHFLAKENKICGEDELSVTYISNFTFEGLKYIVLLKSVVGKEDNFFSDNYFII